MSSSITQPACLTSLSDVELENDGGQLSLLNPGNLDECIAELSLAGASDATRMMDAAAAAFPEWAATPVEERLGLLSKALNNLEAESEEAARRLTAENGKPLAEARGEVAGTLKDGRWQIDMMRQFGHDVVKHDAEGKVAGTVRYSPSGVYALITPWNFPLATVLRKVIPALAWGNTVVVKPAQQTPWASHLFMQHLHRAGVPVAAVQFALGKGSIIGNALLDHKALKGVSFTGSTEVGLGLCRRVAGRDVKLQMEMGGKNALVVLADANIPAAVEAAAVAGFTCSGQWCTSTSRVLIESTIYETFVEQILSRIAEIRVGSGSSEGVTMGPVSSMGHRRDILKAIATGKEEGATLLCGGKGPEQIEGKRGCFVEPTVFGDVHPEMFLFREEIFGPVVALTRVMDADEALRLANDSPYGLSFSLYTQDNAVAEHFMEAIECGSVHHNLHTGYRHPAMPLTGWKDSGIGTPECGDFAREFYTRPKGIYQKNI